MKPSYNLKEIKENLEESGENGEFLIYILHFLKIFIFCVFIPKKPFSIFEY